MRVPAALQREWRRESAWLTDLPRLAAECAELWGLALEEPFDTPHSLVVPAGDVVLKLNAPSHFEADHETEALARWAGRGAVQLTARDDARRALLIERCRPGTRLRDAGTDEPAVVAALLPRLWGEPDKPHPFRFLADEAERWVEDVPRHYELGGRPFERSLLDFAVDVFRTVDRTATSLVNQDLHGGNILRAEREPWLVIDPKPLLGEREANAVGLLRNAAGGGAASVRRWLDVLQELGLDRERLRAWGVAHALAWGWDEDGRWSPWSVEVSRTLFAAWG
ncbi:MAG: aminoglycoside phosphotransferase family protein [Gaiellaceae bacterium]